MLAAELREPKKTDAGQALASARAAVMKAHGLALSHVLLLEPRTIPKTTSGKIARAWCKKRFLAGELKVVKGGRGKFDVEGEADVVGGEEIVEKKERDQKKVAEIRAMSDADIVVKVSAWGEVRGAKRRDEKAFDEGVFTWYRRPKPVLSNRTLLLPTLLQFLTP